MSFNLGEGFVIYTEDEILEIGLLLLKYAPKRIRRAKRTTNKHRFKVHFGVPPDVAALVFSDLQTTTTFDALLPPSSRNVNHFLMALHHLKIYPTEIQREPQFDVSLSHGRDKVWYYIRKIQALKEEKIVWPTDNGGPGVWMLTVDGIHCWIKEPRHPIWSQDRKYYSHKYAHAGLAYELAISLTGGLIWMKGPYRAGRNDKLNYVEGGLQEKLRSVGRKGIADQGYTGYYDTISTPNAHDDDEVKRFKSRASMRHEAFNGLVKSFGCLNGRFRHSQARFKNCFEAVCVLCQYQVENNHPLFDILLEDMSY